ncbi:MAG TPA: bifunctional riboflavin kinase/FAD synthetase [Bacteroidales bacterium]|nr:bifunctional riboflavin kinase/FAD synthetase [Bacteroidales bacterium]
MIIHEGYENLNLVSPVATLGIFDGVHLGHRALLDRVVLKAKEEKSESVVITFSPHPRLVLEKNNINLSFLTTTEEKIVLLAKANVDHLIMIKFTPEFSNIPACDFLKDILVGKIGTKYLVIGHDHRFGRRGEGDFNTIRHCAKDLDFTVEQVEGYHTEDGMISSSLIRGALLNGNIEEANNWLGYPYAITGKIIEGRKLGRKIGFPTANIKPSSEHKLIPANGVYAVEVQLDNKKMQGMLSIGTNPTVNADVNFRSIEVNILNFDEEIYGRNITVIFRKKLRDEKKFRNLDELAQQMGRDKQETLGFLT